MLYPVFENHVGCVFGPVDVVFGISLEEKWVYFREKVTLVMVLLRFVRHSCFLGPNFWEVYYWDVNGSIQKDDMAWFHWLLQLFPGGGGFLFL